MSKNFDELPAAAALDGTETIPANQGGFTVKITTAILSAWATATALTSHLAAFAHADIAHSNRMALDIVSGINSGDQDLSGLAPLDSPSFSTGIVLPNSSSALPNMLDWYLEGDWTPYDNSGANLTFTASDCKYTRIGNMVFLSGKITYPTTANGSSASVGGLPYTPAQIQNGVAFAVGGATTAASLEVQTNGTFQFYDHTGAAAPRANSVLSTQVLHINIAYRV